MNRYLLIAVAFALSLMSWCVMAGENKVALVIAKDGFRDEELKVSLDIFQSAGCKVLVFGDETGEAKGMLGGIFNIERAIGEMRTEEYKAVVFIGGAGAEVFWDSAVAHEVARKTIKDGKILAAICVAPVTLANSGVLKGKKATVWYSEADKLENNGAKYTGSDVEVDGNIVTANGPDATEKFAREILKLTK